MSRFGLCDIVVLFVYPSTLTSVGSRTQSVVGKLHKSDGCLGQTVRMAQHGSAKASPY